MNNHNFNKNNNVGDGTRRRIYEITIELSFAYSEKNDELHKNTITLVQKILEAQPIILNHFCKELFGQWQGEMLKLRKEEERKNKERLKSIEENNSNRINSALFEEEDALKEYEIKQYDNTNFMKMNSFQCINARLTKREEFWILELQLQIINKKKYKDFLEMHNYDLCYLLTEICYFSAINLRYFIRKILKLNVNENPLNNLVKMDKIRRSLIYNYYSNSYKQVLQYNQIVRSITNLLAPSNEKQGTFITINELFGKKNETTIVLFINKALQEIKHEL